jgi:Zn-dependent protease with chaperone function
VILYAVTAALEVPAIVARYVALYVAAVIALKATGNATGDASEVARLAIVPALWSAVALVNPTGGGRWWREQLGGREPSRREYEAYHGALRALEAGTMFLLAQPKMWFVLDESEPDAAVCGDALMLTRGLLEGPSESLSAVLAHQLGHLQGMDARLTAALNRLVLGVRRAPKASVEAKTRAGEKPATSPPPTPGPARQRTIVLPSGKAGNTMLAWMLVRWATRMALALVRGGVGLRLTAAGWGQICREQEYEADRFAAHIGWGEQLADFLEAEQLKHDHPIPLVALTNHTHPPTELRIEALRVLAKRQPHARGQAQPQLLGAENGHG